MAVITKVNTVKNRFLIFYLSFTLIGIFLWFFFGSGWFFLLIFIRQLFFSLNILFIPTATWLHKPQKVETVIPGWNPNNKRIFRSNLSIAVLIMYFLLSVVAFWKVNISILEIINHFISTSRSG